MKIHFIGIGGIGISAIARMYLAEGNQISSSDRSGSAITKELSTLGVDVKIGHDAKNIPPDCELVIYTIAVDSNNPELLEAKRLTIKILSYPQALGELTTKKKTVAISGTHGKTTTTAMIAKIFLDAGLDPTVIVGSLMNPSTNSVQAATNFIAGKGDYLIVEACEYRRSFLNLHPQILVITNIDNDHLDYYKDIDDIKSAFEEIKARVPADGKIITEKEYSQIALPIKLLAPGVHNQKNAQAAIAVALTVGISEEAARQTLAAFTGTWRRFEFKGQTKVGALVYDDYAHHPSEIRATLAGAREAFPNHQIIAIFQPHLYSRTKLLFNDFSTSFKDASEVILLPIYAAREVLDPSISSEILAEAVKKQGIPARAVANFVTAEKFVRNLGLDEKTLIITIGAGDVYQIADKLI